MAIFRRLKAAGIETKSQSQVMKGRKLTPEHRAKVIRTLRNGVNARGENNPAWKGGRSWVGRSKDDKNTHYVLIRVDGKYVKEHRYVMEQHLDRKLLTTEEVHHINGDKFDNRLKNLQVLSKSEHAKLHNADPELRKYKAEKSRQARANRYWSTKPKT